MNAYGWKTSALPLSLLFNLGGSGKVKLISKWQFPTFPVRSLGTLSSHFRLPAIFGKAIAREKDIKILPRSHFNKELSLRGTKSGWIAGAERI